MSASAAAGTSSGVGATVLKNLDVDIKKLRLEIEKLVKSGPDMVTMGKLPQTPRAKKVIEYSMDEARNLNHNYVGTEHILLGLLREQDGVAAQVLMNLGLKLEEVRDRAVVAIRPQLGSVGRLHQPCRNPDPVAESLYAAFEQVVGADGAQRRVDEIMQTVGSKTFVLRGGTWVDTAFDVLENDRVGRLFSDLKESHQRVLVGDHVEAPFEARVAAGYSKCCRICFLDTTQTDR